MQVHKNIINWLLNFPFNIDNVFFNQAAFSRSKILGILTQNFFFINKYNMGKAKPDFLSTVHSTKKVQSGFIKSTHIVITITDISCF